RIIQEWRRAWEQKAASGMTALEQDAYDTFNREHPHATADEKADFIRDLRTRTRNADQEFADRWWDEHPNGTSEQFSEAFGRYKKGQKFPPGDAAGNTALTSERQIAAAVQKKIEQWREEGVPEDEINTRAAQERSRLRTASAGITGNRKEQLEGH